MHAGTELSSRTPAAEGRPPIVVIVFCYNEKGKLDRALKRFCGSLDWDVWVMDDGSNDGSTDGIEAAFDVRLLRHDRNRGAGAAVRTAFQHFRESGYQVAVPAAGNDKDRPEDVLRVAGPVLRGQADVVQGSRYLPGGQTGNMPLYRQLATRYLHPLLFSALVGRRFTDTTNGFRAVARHVLEDPRIDLSSPKLDHYELEPYFLYRVLECGYRMFEVPVSKIYPDHKLGYTKIKPITGWWSLLKPLVYLALRIWK